MALRRSMGRMSHLGGPINGLGWAEPDRTEPGKHQEIDGNREGNRARVSNIDRVAHHTSKHGLQLIISSCSQIPPTPKQSLRKPKGTQSESSAVDLVEEEEEEEEEDDESFYLLRNDARSIHFLAIHGPLFTKTRRLVSPFFFLSLSFFYLCFRFISVNFKYISMFFA